MIVKLFIGWGEIRVVAVELGVKLLGKAGMRTSRSIVRYSRNDSHEGKSSDDYMNTVSLSQAWDRQTFILK